MNDLLPTTQWLVHVASKGALVLGVALLVGLGLRRVAAARRYAVWMTALVTLGMLPLAMLVLPPWRVLPQTQAVSPAIEWPVEEVPETAEGADVAAADAMPMQAIAIPAVPAPPVTGVTPRAASPSFHFTWDDGVAMVPWIWLTMAAMLLARLGWGVWCLRRLERSLSSGSSEVLNETVRETGLKRTPGLLIGARDAVPMVWGVWRTRLLLPEGFAQWPVEKQRGVMLHELAHLQRGDPLALWTAQWVKVLHWFNPLVWLTVRQLRADQERACDDTVLRHGVRASDYAQHLLDLSRHTRVAPGLALCALTMTRCSPVESRVQAILDPRRSREGLTRPWLLALVGMALLATLPVAMLHAIEGAKLRGRILDRNGVVLAESTTEQVRHYPLETLTAHLVGYTGKTSPDDPTTAGRFAAEKRHDAELRQGRDVALTLDARIQKLTTQAMQDSGIQRGAAVVLDPRTGEILAAVSLPSFDPNWFVPTLPIERWDVLAKDTGTPLLDRCFSHEYPPGAAFMPFTALAGLSAGVGNRTYVCNGSVTYGARNFQCWKGVRDQAGHGALNITGALAGSCHCYWYQFGNEAGLDAFDKVAHSLGLGQGYGLNDREQEAPAPKFAFIQEAHRRAAGGDLANISIGQGRVLLTPLQMAVLAATVANRGKVPQPNLVWDERSPKWRADLTSSAGVPAAEVENIREGMRLVVNGDAGTAKAAKSDKVVIAGKTGAAQAWRRVENARVDDNKVWFIGFAPYDAPTLAFAILKEGGKSGGSDCASIAKRLVEETLALPADGSGEVSPVEVPAGVGRKRSETHSEKLKRLNKQREDWEEKAKAAHQRLLELEARAGVLRQKQPVDQGALDGVFNGLRETINSRHSSPAGAKFVGKAEMGAAETERWQKLQKEGALADLPAQARVQMLTQDDSRELGALSNISFRFSGAREDVRAWLLASVSEKMQKAYARMLPWPETPQPFERMCPVAGGCLISLYSLDGLTIHVVVSQYRLPPMIAPDEATPPRPKTAAPKELEGVVDVEPDLNGQLSSLPPPQSVEDELQGLAFSGDFASPRRVQWPPTSWRSAFIKEPVYEQRVIGPSREETDKLRDLVPQHRDTRNYADTTLWVKPPEGM